MLRVLSVWESEVMKVIFSVLLSIFLCAGLVWGGDEIFDYRMYNSTYKCFKFKDFVTCVMDRAFEIHKNVYLLSLWSMKSSQSSGPDRKSSDFRMFPENHLSLYTDCRSDMFILAEMILPSEDGIVRYIWMLPYMLEASTELKQKIFSSGVCNNIVPSSLDEYLVLSVDNIIEKGHHIKGVSSLRTREIMWSIYRDVPRKLYYITISSLLPVIIHRDLIIDVYFDYINAVMNWLNKVYLTGKTIKVLSEFELMEKSGDRDSRVVFLGFMEGTARACVTLRNLACVAFFDGGQGRFFIDTPQLEFRDGRLIPSLFVNMSGYVPVELVVFDSGGLLEKYSSSLWRPYVGSISVENEFSKMVDKTVGVFSDLMKVVDSCRSGDDLWDIFIKYSFNDGQDLAVIKYDRCRPDAFSVLDFKVPSGGRVEDISSYLNTKYRVNLGQDRTLIILTEYFRDLARKGHDVRRVVREILTDIEKRDYHFRNMLNFVKRRNVITGETKKVWTENVTEPVEGEKIRKGGVKNRGGKSK